MVYFKCLKYIYVQILLVFCFFQTGFSQDTIPYASNLKPGTNEDLEKAIELYEKYIQSKSKGPIEYLNFWNEKEIEKYKQPDLAIHSVFPENTKIMGLAKIDSSTFILKTVGYMPQAQIIKNPDIMYIYNYMIYKDGYNYRLGNYLEYILKEKKVQKYAGNYADYFWYDKERIAESEYIFKQIEEFFQSKFKERFTIINFDNSLDYLKYRGYDFFIGSFNSKVTVSGLFNAPNNILYTTGQHKVHVHEILRSLHKLLPNSPELLRSGTANLIGGSLGLSIEENIRLIYPYILKNKNLLNNVEEFYYYDDQVVPDAVFTGIITNYYIKKFGLESFKTVMKSNNDADISINDFLKKYCNVSDIPNFFLSEMSLYLNKKLEFSNLL